MIKIDKGIEAPIKPKSGRRTKNPFREMEVGDSFLFETKKACSAYSMTSAAAKKLGINLTVMKTAQGYRVWRIA